MNARLAALALLVAVCGAGPAFGEEPDAEAVGAGDMWDEAEASEDDAYEREAEASVDDAYVDAYGEEIFDEAEGERAGGISDPWEGLNRKTFAFNEWADRWIVEPIAIGWDFVVPDPAQHGIDHFFDNINLPRRIVNDLLQGKPAKAGDDFGRLLINTTFGIAGLFDVATDVGLPPADEDFGQTLGVWGTPPGPYLVIPVLGPSNVRDAGGLAFEGFVMTPEYYFMPFYVSYISTGTRLLNTRALAIETLRAERAAAFDFYSAVRSAYVQYRENQVRDRADAPEETDEGLYYSEDDDVAY
jgi:phospholipid-binding lipoprotein MlaA